MRIIRLTALMAAGLALAVLDIVKSNGAAVAAARDVKLSLVS